MLRCQYIRVCRERMIFINRLQQQSIDRVLYRCYFVHVRTCWNVRDGRVLHLVGTCGVLPSAELRSRLSHGFVLSALRFLEGKRLLIVTQSPHRIIGFCPVVAVQYTRQYQSCGTMCHVNDNAAVVVITSNLRQKSSRHRIGLKKTLEWENTSGKIKYE